MRDNTQQTEVWTTKRKSKDFSNVKSKKLKTVTLQKNRPTSKYRGTVTYVTKKDSMTCELVFFLICVCT